jgi:hypothetical protein
VNLADVQVERARMKKIMAPYAPEDQFNGDESRFYPSCPPDASLTTKLTASGKKIKNAVTTFFITNETGTEKEEVVFIGKAKKPWCFKRKMPKMMGFAYWNNRKAWMTAVIFEEWVTIVYAT